MLLILASKFQGKGAPPPILSGRKKSHWITTKAARKKVGNKLSALQAARKRSEMFFTGNCDRKKN
jgi:hypothetical protein